MRRDTRTAYRARVAATERSVDEAVRAVQAERAAEWDERKATADAAKQAEADRVKLTAEDVKDARAIRTADGWHKVVRVNKTSVTVETPWSWTDRISIDRITEVAR